MLSVHELLTDKHTYVRTPPCPVNGIKTVDHRHQILSSIPIFNPKSDKQNLLQTICYFGLVFQKKS